MKNKNPISNNENLDIDDLMDEIKLLSEEVLKIIQVLSIQDFQEEGLKEHINYLYKNKR